MNTCEFLSLYAMLIIKARQWTNLIIETENVCLLGIHLDKKGWKLFDLEKEVFLVSRDIHFIEEVFPFQEGQTIKLQVAQTGSCIINVFLGEHSHWANLQCFHG